MGSSFSIVNDTDDPIWVSDGVCHAALWGSISAALGVVTLGAGMAASAAAGATSAAAATFLALPEATAVMTLQGALYTSAQAAGVVLASGATFAGLSAAFFTTVASISSVLSISSGVASALSETEKKKLYDMKKELEKQLEGFLKINPGEKYVFNGTLSLVKTAYVVFDNGKTSRCNVWTAPTAGNNFDYNVSEYF